MKHVKPKSKTLEEHTERRFAERFGVKLTQFLWDNIIHQIHSGKATFYKKQSNRVSIWDVTVYIRQQEVDNERLAKVGHLTVRIVYDKMRKCLVSVLTLDMDCEPDDEVFQYDDTMQ
jgi:hypothetical protein